MDAAFFTKRPKFEIEQLIAASEAARNFSALRRNAKTSPRLILENNKPDSVLMNIDDYESLYKLIDTLEEEVSALRVALRIKETDAGLKRTYSLDEVLGEDGIKAMEEMKNWDISDNDLFEWLGVVEEIMAKFEIKFFEEAKAEYEALDGSEKKYVLKALEKISERGHEIGDPLENKRGINLAGCRKVKLKRQGIRIVYRINNRNNIEIIDIIAIGSTADEAVYKDADKRLK